MKTIIIFIIFILLPFFIDSVDKYKIFDILSKITNPIYKYTSLIGNEPFYKDSLLETSSFLTKNWKVFRDEAVASASTYTSIKGDLFFDDIVNTQPEWKKLYIKWYSDIDPIARRKCPRSCELIESRPDIKIAMFSVLSPGARINPHFGLNKGCIRYHLGLDTPNSPDCYINLNEIKYSWRDGEGILLDDTYQHWVVNNTNKTRIILFCDIVRPMSLFGKNINEFMMNTFGHYTSRGN